MNEPATPSSPAPTSPAPTSPAQTSPAQTTPTEKNPGAESGALDIAGIINLRDVGGYPTTSGETVATSLLYRSGRLGFEGQAGIDALAKLGLSTVFDLRSAAECSSLPDRVPPGVDLVHLDVLADAVTSLAAHLADMFEDPVAAEELLQSGKIREHYLGTYRNLITSEAACAAYREMFLQIANLDSPALFHCTAGKDRTGWAAAALLSLLGVAEETVFEDYLLSSAPVLVSFQPYLDQFAAAGGNPELLKPAFTVEPDYLATSLSEVQAQFGSVEGYFRTGLGLSDDITQQIRQRLLR
ncbi:protein tyrosine/serine phosphatase [Actinobacteria bacterium IMCC26207]|nr:protein tyrosine/serine phosphatase [Actinobacteria bacterium IMCC26207]